MKLRCCFLTVSRNSVHRSPRENWLNSSSSNKNNNSNNSNSSSNNNNNSISWSAPPSSCRPPFLYENNFWKLPPPKKKTKKQKSPIRHRITIANQNLHHTIGDRDVSAFFCVIFNFPSTRPGGRRWWTQPRAFKFSSRFFINKLIQSNPPLLYGRALTLWSV